MFKRRGQSAKGAKRPDRKASQVTFKRRGQSAKGAKRPTVAGTPR